MERRSFILRATAWSLAGLASTKAVLAQALLNPGEQLAKTLGYAEDATKVDAKKWPTWKAGNKCSSCNLYKAAGADRGSCTLFPGKLVKAAGWCSTWVAIPKK
jgi:hypothetical protein